NTASGSLLEHVAGLSKTTAKNIIKKREEIGKFSSRRELSKDPRLGPKTYEQSNGFLRIAEGEHPFDDTYSHPESYQQTEKLLVDLGFSLEDLGSDAFQQALTEVDSNQVADELNIGVLTLEDIINALQKPGRDMREDFPQPILKQKVLTLEDL